MRRIADVERIARAYYEEANEIYKTIHDERGLEPWEALTETAKEPYREVTRRLLHRNVIQVGHRPTVERPMEGQTSIYDEPPV